MVGILSCFLLGPSLFSGALAVSFREDIGSFKGCVYICPYFGLCEPNLTIIFFRWVETTTLEMVIQGGWWNRTTNFPEIPGLPGNSMPSRPRCVAVKCFKLVEANVDFGGPI